MADRSSQRESSTPRSMWWEVRSLLWMWEASKGKELACLGVPGGGIGQGGAAGISSGLRAAPADPAILAVLQQLLPSNHAIAAPISCLEKSQAYPRQQKSAVASGKRVICMIYCYRHRSCSTCYIGRLRSSSSSNSSLFCRPTNLPGVLSPGACWPRGRTAP